MRYFEVEERLADVSTDCLVLTAERAKPLIDENTIGVCPILGSTYNGEFEDVKGREGGREGGRRMRRMAIFILLIHLSSFSYDLTHSLTAIHDMLEALNAETGWDVPIHVDAASGGFIGQWFRGEEGGREGGRERMTCHAKAYLHADTHTYLHTHMHTLFAAPFINPDLVWDFRLPLVKSINASGHKFG